MLAERTPNIQEIMRRFFLALNDESGAVPFGVSESLGEILSKRPDLQKEYLCILMSHLYNKDQLEKNVHLSLQTVNENNYLAQATTSWAIG